MAPSRRLRVAARHLGCSSVLGSEETDPPLGSLDGVQPPLRCFTVAELGTSAAAAGDDVAPLRAWPDKLPDDHPAVLQFKRLGYVVITDAVAPGPLRRATEVFHSKQERARQIREVGRHLQQVRPGHSPEEPSEQYFDLPREDIGIVPEAFNTGAHGGFLVTQDAADFSAYMEILANPQVLPLLLALVGPAMHLEEVGARTVEAPPLEQALKYGGYTEWHRDAGGRSASAVAASPSSTGLAPQRLPIGSVGCDYNRVKCFAMLTDVDADGGCAPTSRSYCLAKSVYSRGTYVSWSCFTSSWHKFCCSPLGLVPGSHLMWGSPPDEFQGGNMDNMPGHVKVTVPAGGMALFDQRCWVRSARTLPRSSSASENLSNGSEKVHRRVSLGPGAYTTFILLDCVRALICSLAWRCVERSIPACR